MRDILQKYIYDIGRSAFTTGDLAAFSNKSISSVVQSLKRYEAAGLVTKVTRGIWADAGRKDLSQYSIIPILFSKQRVYVSFLSALHLHGIIEQIPQVVMIASIKHTSKIKTMLGPYEIHRISPSFFKGFDWYKGESSFLIADPDKALVDCFYISAHKKNQFGRFPELDLAKINIKKTYDWVKLIKNKSILINVKTKLDKLFSFKKIC